MKDFSNKNGYDLNRNGDSGPLLLDVLEGFLKYEVCYYLHSDKTFSSLSQLALRFSLMFLCLIIMHCGELNAAN